MQQTEITIFSHLKQWLNNGQPAWLVTIIDTWGSAPRGKGSLMACNHRGETIGSISGGCLEEDLLENLQDANFITKHSAHPSEIIYGETAQEQHRLQLPCGGKLKILLEPFAPNSHGIEHCTTIIDVLTRRQSIERTVNLTDNTKIAAHSSAPPSVTLSGHTLKQVLGPHSRLLLIGAGPVSQHAAQFALTLGYEVEVCDPRPRYIQQWQSLQPSSLKAISLTTEMPDDVVRKRFHDCYSAVVALAHDPRIDDMGLMEALRSHAFYVGALGSTRTTEKRIERLRQLNLTESQIASLHAPVGLNIGSHTPAEIALSLMAELTLIKNKNSAKASHKLDAPQTKAGQLS